MGIDVSHSLLIGCSYDELEDFFEKVIEQCATENLGNWFISRGYYEKITYC